MRVHSEARPAGVRRPDERVREPDRARRTAAVVSAQEAGVTGRLLPGSLLVTSAWPSWLSLMISILSGAVVLYWGGQDKQGQFQPDLLLSNAGYSIFFVGPYLVLAIAAILSRRR